MEKKTNEGITLIALVVTIIVLLILAGITISLVIGQNGIITRANNANLKQDQGAVLEGMKMKLTEVFIDQSAKNTSETQMEYLRNSGIIDENNIVSVENLLFQKLKSGNGTGTSDVYKIEEGHLKYYDKNGEITDLGDLNITGKIIVENDELLKYLVFDETTGMIIGLKNCTEYYNPYPQTGHTVFPIEDVVIPKEINGVKVIGIKENVFARCTSMKSLTIQSNIQILERDAFSRCENLKTLYIEDGMKLIDSYAFEKMENLVEVRLPETLTEIDDGMFSGCNKLKQITIPESVEIIRDGAFEGCSELTNINIPNKVKEIGYDAFDDCTNLETITMSNNIQKIGERAFRNTKWYSNLPDGGVYIGNIYYNYKGEMPSGTTITIKEGTKWISDSGFSDCTNLVGVHIPNSVVEIGEYAFYGCTSLTNIIIPNSVERIGENAFNNCTELTEITIPGSVKVIEYLVLANCTKLSNLIISEGVTRIAYNVFSGSTNLKSIVLPNSIEEIETYAFEGSSLTNITIQKPKDSISGAPWSADGATVTWNS